MRVKLTTDEAISLLPEGDMIHTFMNPAGILLGTDHDRKHISETLCRYPIELSGPLAARMGHGLVVLTDHGHLFVATDAEKLKAFVTDTIETQ